MAGRYWHLRWCNRRHCTAYVDVERSHHRSGPLVFASEDPDISYFVHIGADQDGSGPFLDVGCLEQPVEGPWWHPRMYDAWVFLPLPQAVALYAAMSRLLPYLAPAGQGSI